MVKLIIFDWDDVFTLGAKEGYYACYRKAINDVGVNLSPEEENKRILAKWGKSFKEELKELLKEKPELIDTASEIFERAYWGDTFVDALSVIEGTNEMLVRLKDKYKLAVATGNHHKMLKDRIFPHFSIPDVFLQIISSHEIEDQEKTKPHPYMLEVIMKNLNVSPNETIFVGDAKTDVQMAYSADVEPVVVLSGHLSKEEAKELGVKHIIDNVTLLEKELERFN
ncbi:MAG: HAD family hydrolase [Candidatus Levybacteria bacterium]|nr:HAD family hydrolase [Candidatus Levybacteria bacterium]